MENTEKERRISRYKSRKRRLSYGLENQAVRTEETRNGGVCDICVRQERSGGLIVFRLRDGSELLAGHRCAEYLDHLSSLPRVRADYLLRIE